MMDLLAKLIPSLLALGAAVFCFLRWRRKKNVWLLLAMVTAILAAAGFWLDAVIGGFLGFQALALLLLGLWTKRGRI